MTVVVEFAPGDRVFVSPANGDAPAALAGVRGTIVDLRGSNAVVALSMRGSQRLEVDVRHLCRDRRRLQREITWPGVPCAEATAAARTG